MMKIMAFDLDGTAIIAHKIMPDENRNAVIKAYESGVITVPCTGRLLSFLPEEVANLPGLKYVITCNGASVEDIENGTKLYTAFIPTEKIAEVFDIIDEYDIYAEFYSDGQAYTVTGNPERARTDFDFPEEKIHFTTKNYIFTDNLKEFAKANKMVADKINLPYLPDVIRQEVKDRINAIEGLKLTSSISDNLEINDAGATKGQALKHLCDYLGIDKEDCMAIGDNGNDADMLEYAGLSYAMANASDEAMRAAKFKTGYCEEFGFRDAILKELNK
ncbi:MAG: HAD family hydrolase [Clostridia bacterium]|nr:HAD family hydrolase [Clostridia bacterium]